VQRLRIELTSRQPDGSWTWRAAGARQPKGVLRAELVPPGSKIGDILKAEVEMSLDGIDVLSAEPPPPPRQPAGETIDLLSPAVRSLAATAGADIQGAYEERGSRTRLGQRPGEKGKGRNAGSANRSGASRLGIRTNGGTPGTGPSRRASLAGQRDASSASSGSQRGARPAQGTRERGLVIGDTHKKQFLEGLRPEQVPVAEQLFKGGMPAVRSAIERQKQAGGTPVSEEVLIAIAEQLAPEVSKVLWLDRTDAILEDLEHAPLRELRSAVSGGLALVLDAAGKERHARLREALRERIAAEEKRWLSSLEQDLEKGRILQALQRSARPPGSVTRMPAQLASQLASAAGAAMKPELDVDEWAALLEAVLASPVRRLVKPEGLPEKAPPALRQTCARAAGQVPALAPLLGIPVPPPTPGPGARGNKARQVVSS